MWFPSLWQEEKFIVYWVFHTGASFLTRGSSPRIRIISFFNVMKNHEKKPMNARRYWVCSAVLAVLTLKEIPLAITPIKTRYKNVTVWTWVLPPGFISLQIGFVSWTKLSIWFNQRSRIFNEMNPGSRTHVKTVALLYRVLMSLNANGISFNVKMAKTAEQTQYRLAFVGFFSVIFHNVKKRNYPYYWAGPPSKEGCTSLENSIYNE